MVWKQSAVVSNTRPPTCTHQLLSRIRQRPQPFKSYMSIISKEFRTPDGGCAHTKGIKEIAPKKIFRCCSPSRSRYIFCTGEKDNPRWCDTELLCNRTVLRLRYIIYEYFVCATVLQVTCHRKKVQVQMGSYDDQTVLWDCTIIYMVLIHEVYDSTSRLCRDLAAKNAFQAFALFTGIRRRRFWARDTNVSK